MHPLLSDQIAIQHRLDLRADANRRRCERGACAYSAMDRSDIIPESVRRRLANVLIGLGRRLEPPRHAAG